MIDRRSVLAAIGSTFAGSALGFPFRTFAAAAGLEFGRPQPFSFDALSSEMRSRALQPHAQQNPLPQSVLDRRQTAPPGSFPTAPALPGFACRKAVRLTNRSSTGTPMPTVPSK
jgi:hypothetical protein